MSLNWPSINPSLRHLVLLLCAISIFTSLDGQVRGKIIEKDGSPLPFAAVYIEGTSIGTVSNVDGQYELILPHHGSYKINFQYVGFKNHRVAVTYTGAPIIKDIVMEEDALFLNEVVITPDKEDPAYAIMRQAIAHRKENKNRIKSLEADLYVKGSIRLNEVPEKLLGEELGNLQGILDSTRQGYIYLSESKSKYYFMQPDRAKEVMISTIKSGDNSLFTANQFSWANFDLYDEYIKMGRTIVSPLADNALSHYDFKLEQTTTDNNDFVIHKIRLLPKTKNAPLLNGSIFIVDGYWTIYSSDLSIYGVALKNTFIDTIDVKQVFIPIDDRETWRIFSQVFTFKAGLLGFKIGGHFSYIFSNYILNQDLTSIFKDNETFRIEKDALQRDTAFWNKERPIPLTEEEMKDYVKKDSLYTLWNTKSYQDSVDRVNNKFSPLHLMLGYTYRNSYKNYQFKIPSPLTSLSFNAVEGFTFLLNPSWTKSDSTFKKLVIQPALAYGFSDKQLKPQLSVRYTFDNYSLGQLWLSGGRSYDQYDERKPINDKSNAWSSLWDKNNKIRLYRNDFVTAGYSQEIINGLYIDLSFTYTDRSNLEVHSQYSFRKKNKKYEANIPTSSVPTAALEPSTFFKNKLKFIIKPGQKYSSYPNFKLRDASNWPTLTTEYEWGIGLSEGAHQYHKLAVKIRDQYVNLRLLGYFKYNMEAASFIGKAPQYFIDYLHTMGNRIAIPIDPDLGSFNLLPFYEYSSDSYYLKANFRHYFNGFIFDKIPLINKTPLKLVFGGSALYVPNKGTYWEPFIGIENFRIGPIHLFDIDYAFGFGQNGYRDHGIVFRLSQLFNQ